MLENGNGMTARVVDLALVLQDIKQAEADVEHWHATGAQAGPDVPSLAFLDVVLNCAKDRYMQQLRALSQGELRALVTLIN